GAVVEIDLLVRATGHAHPPALALVLVHQDYPVLFALVHGARRAGGDAGRVQAVLADSRQVEHERLLELQLHLLADLREDRVPGQDLGAATEVVVPVGGPFHLHRFAGDQAARWRDRHLFTERGAGEVFVIVGPRLVVIVDRRHFRVGENRAELLDPPTGTQPQPTAFVPDPAARPLFLVLVGAGITLPR